MPTSPNARQRNQKEFKHNRLALLKENPLCHWCGVRPATTADHLIETDRGGTNDIANMVQACRTCNSRRGQSYRVRKERNLNGNQIALKLYPNSDNSDENIMGVFYTPTGKPPQARVRISHKGLTANESSKLGSEINELDITNFADWVQHDEPRLQTYLPQGVKSHAGAITKWAMENMEVELMPWQRLALHGQTAYDSAGNFLHRVSLTSTARQNGKTVVSAALVGWWLTEYAKQLKNPQTVMNLAHLLETAQEFFEYLGPILEKKFGAKLKESYGRSVCLMPDNSKWWARAATLKAGHSKTIDLIDVDEVWAVAPTVIDIGLMPTQRTRKNPLMSMWSTAGDETSKSMLRWREQGLAAIDSGKQTKLYFAEWSPPKELDPMTPAAWAWGNPALDHKLEMETIIAESESPDRNGFLRSSANLWQASAKSWLTPGIWEALKTDKEIPPGGILVLETSIDDGRYSGVRAVQVEKTTYVKTVFIADTLAEMWELTAKEIAKAPNLRLAIVPTLEIHCPPNYADRVTIVGYRELLKWTAAVLAMIKEKRVAHNGEHRLAEHVNRAVLIRHEGHIAISSTRSPGPIELARSMIWAVALISRPTNSMRPIVVSG